MAVMIPEVDTGRVLLSGSIGLAHDAPADSNGSPIFYSGDALGWAPGFLDKFDFAGDFVAILQEYPTKGAFEVSYIRSTGEERSLSSVMVSDAYYNCIAELFPNSTVSPANADVPGFTFITLLAGVFESLHVSLNDLYTPEQATVWDNELSATDDEIRLVSGIGPALVPIGTIIVVSGNSTIYPGQPAIFLKNTGDPAGSSGPAQEILYDLRPTDLYTVDLSRLHVVDLGNGQLNFYYAVTNTQTDRRSTAVFTYWLPRTQDPSLTFDVQAVVLRPTLVLSGYVPTVSRRGARRHPVSNEIILALEHEDDTSGQTIRWFATRGQGIRFDTTPLVWDADTHPFLFGGRWADGAPDRSIAVSSVGWKGNRAGNGFTVLGAIVIGEVPAYRTEFLNYYDLTINDNDIAPRMLLGSIQPLKSEGESGADGAYALVSQKTAPWSLHERDRRGYDAEDDPLEVAIYNGFDDPSDPNAFTSEIGASATASDVVHGPGRIRGAKVLFQDDSLITFAADVAYDTDSVCFSLWVYLEISDAPSATRIIFLKPRNNLSSTPVLRLIWDEVAGDLIFRVRWFSAGNVDLQLPADLLPLPENRWYHVACVVDEVEAFMYLNGVLVASDSVAGPDALDHNASTPLSLGGDANSFRGRVDEFIYCAEAAFGIGFRYRLLRSLLSSMQDTDGLPLRSIMSTDLALGDGVAATTVVQADDVVLTCCARQVCLSLVPALDRVVAFDVWTRTRGGDPEYAGIIAPPIEVMDAISASSVFSPRVVGTERALSDKYEGFDLAPKWTQFSATLGDTFDTDRYYLRITPGLAAGLVASPNRTPGPGAYESIAGDFDVRCAMELRNATDTGYAADNTGRSACLYVSQDTSQLNWIEISIGTTGAGFRIATASASSVGVFVETTAAAVATLNYDLRIIRVGQIFLTLYRAHNDAIPLHDNDGWTILGVFVRIGDPLPNTLLVWGGMLRTTGLTFASTLRTTEIVVMHDFSRHNLEIRALYAKELTYLFIPMWCEQSNVTRIYLVIFDHTDLDAVGLGDWTLVAEISSDAYVSGMDIVEWEAETLTDDEYWVVLSVYTPGTFSAKRVYFITPSDFGAGALSTAAYAGVADLLPSGTSGSFFGYDYAADFGDGSATTPVIQGLVARRIDPDMGWHSDFHGDVQLIFGVASALGAAAVPEPALIGTIVALVPRAEIDAVARPITMTLNGRQLDEYAFGGTDPFEPVRWLQNPIGPSGDTLILARTGTRPYCIPQLGGSSGLDVYRLRREGDWGARLLLPVDHLSAPYGTLRTGADMALFRVTDDVPEFQLVVTRPALDAADKASIVYLSEDELEDGGWTVSSPAPVNPVLRRSDNITTVAWSDFVFSTRHFTEEVAGLRIVSDKRYQVAPILRWSIPGYPVDMADRYSQTFDNDLWVEPHQGGAYSGHNRVQRLWHGLTDLYPAIGSNQFRVATQLASTAGDLGEILTDPTTIPGGQERVAAVGIVECPEQEAAFYYFAVYDDTGRPIRVDYYRSPWSGELPVVAGAVFTAWTAPYLLQVGAERSMRLVSVDGTVFLYYTLVSGTRSNLYMIELPQHGDPGSTEPAELVKTLDFRCSDRFYAVVTEHSSGQRVSLYFGDVDLVTSRRTVVMTHNPVEHEIVRQPQQLVVGASPFPRSYAACLGARDDGLDAMILMLESQVSRHDGGAQDLYAAPYDTETPETAESGNTWLVTVCAHDGTVVMSSMQLDGGELRSWFGASFGVDQGSVSKIRAQPHALFRLTTAGEKSTEYGLTAAVRMHLQGPTDFAFRFDDGTLSARRQGFGNNVLLSTLYADTMDPNSGGGSRNNVGLLVPGSLQLETLGGVRLDEGYLHTIGGASFKLDSWAITDDNNWFGQDNTGSPPGGAQIGTDIMNPAVNNVDGVKAASISPDTVFIVGWWQVLEGT